MINKNGAQENKNKPDYGNMQKMNTLDLIDTKLNKHTKHK